MNGNCCLGRRNLDDFNIKSWADTNIIDNTINHLCCLDFECPDRRRFNETTSTNWGGNNYIVGTVFFPDGTRVNMRMPIRLQSLTKGEVLAVTDDSGRFVFSRISNGIYTFVFAGDKDFESVSQDVEIETPRNSGQTFTMMIRLRYKAKSDMKPGVINSENADVPKKALNFYNKGIELARSKEPKDIKDGIEQLKLAVAEYPKFVNAYNEMGIQYMQLNDLEKAEETFRLALKIKSDAFEPLMNRGIVLFSTETIY